MTPTPKESRMILGVVDSRIRYFEGLRDYAIKELVSLRDKKSEIIDTTKEDK